MGKLTTLSLGLNLILILIIAALVNQLNRMPSAPEHLTDLEAAAATYEKFSPDHAHYTTAESEAFALGVDELINNGFIDSIDVFQHIMIVDEEQWKKLTREQQHRRASIVGALFQHKTNDGSLTIRDKQTNHDLAVLNEDGFQISSRN